MIGEKVGIMKNKAGVVALQMHVKLTTHAEIEFAAFSVTRPKKIMSCSREHSAVLCFETLQHNSVNALKSLMIINELNANLLHFDKCTAPYHYLNFSLIDRCFAKATAQNTTLETFYIV